MKNDIYHIKVGDTPLCEWLGCAAGRHNADKAGIPHECSVRGFDKAQARVERLDEHFNVPVTAVKGRCPLSEESDE